MPPAAVFTALDPRFSGLDGAGICPSYFFLLSFPNFVSSFKNSQEMTT